MNIEKEICEGCKGQFGEYQIWEQCGNYYCKPCLIDHRNKHDIQCYICEDWYDEDFMHDNGNGEYACDNCEADQYE